MPKIEGGNLLANLRPTNTVQPVSDVKKAQEASEASKIQPSKSQPTIVEQEKSFDDLEKSYDGGEMDSEAAKKIQEEYREATKTRMAEVSDAVTYRAGEGQSGNVIVDERVGESYTGTTVAPELVRTVSSLTAKMVENTVKTTSTPDKTEDDVLANEFSTTKVELVRQEKKDMQIEKDPTPMPFTEFEQYVQQPIHQRSSYEVTQMMMDYESPVLHPAEPSQLEMTPAQEYKAPVASQDESRDLRDNETRNDAHVLREQRWADTVKETLLHEVDVQEAAVQTSLQSRQRSAEPSQAQVQAAAAVAEPTAEVENVSSGQGESQAVESVAATQNVTPVESTVDETLPEVRPELQSGVAVQAQDATVQASQSDVPTLDLPEYEMPELDLPEYEAPQVDVQASRASTTQVAESAEFEPQIIETGTQVAETTAETGVQEETSVEDYFPDLPGTSATDESNAVDTGSDAAQEYIEKMFSSGTESSSAEHIQTANQRAQVAEDIETATSQVSEPIPVETEPAVSHNVQILSDEELTFLRTGAMNHTVDSQEIPLAPTYEIPENEVVNESWVADAMNYNTTERYSVQLSHGEVDLTQFEDEYVMEEPTTLDDFDYSLVANRISEAVANIAPQEFMSNFGS